jgi:hypothetical protein
MELTHDFWLLREINAVSAYFELFFMLILLNIWNDIILCCERVMKQIFSFQYVWSKISFYWRIKNGNEIKEFLFCIDEESIKKKLERESKHDFESDFFMLNKTTKWYSFQKQILWFFILLKICQNN